MDREYRDESILANRAPFSSFTYTMAAGNGIANPTTLHASWQLVILRPVLRQHTPRYVPGSFLSLVVMSHSLVVSPSNAKVSARPRVSTTLISLQSFYLFLSLFPPLIHFLLLSPFLLTLLYIFFYLLFFLQYSRHSFYFSYAFLFHLLFLAIFS